jgi:hypothetical protein
MSRSRLFVLSTILFVALFDIVTGARLLLSDSPWLVNGEHTLWAIQGAQQPSALAASLFQRLGAFSFHVGVITALWAVLNRHRPGMLTVLLAISPVTGLLFFWNDNLYFQGTPYFTMKSIFGTVWCIALVVHLVSIRRERLVQPETQLAELKLP